MNFREAVAEQAIQDAKALIRNVRYQDAKAKIQEAINVFPTIQHGKEMITLCEMLHLCQKTPKHSRTKTWPYTLLQIPTSSTESEVNSRYWKLRCDLLNLNYSHYSQAAFEELEGAMSLYTENNKVSKKRKAVSSPVSYELAVTSDGNDFKNEGKDNIAVAEDANKAIVEENPAAGGSDDNDDNPYAARSTPEFKKLREHVFAVSPQQPHFIPLAKYCPSVKQEMRLGLDVIFVKLTQKLQNFGGDQILSHEEEETIEAELSNLEEMGYDVSTLKEEFDLLVRVKRLVKEDERYEEKLKNLEDQVGAEKVQLKMVQSRIAELNRKSEIVKDQQYISQLELASLKSKLMKFLKHPSENGR